MRQCGECSLCCRLIPVAEIGKKTGERCSFQRFGKGCTVHGPQQPRQCREWSCAWLLLPMLTLPRPDRAGFIVDLSVDVVVFGADVFTGKKVDALQIWADPKRPDAWRAAVPWIKEAIGEREAVAVIRFGAEGGITLVPPRLSDDGQWVEVDNRVMSPGHAQTVRRLRDEEKLEKAMAQQPAAQDQGVA